MIVYRLICYQLIAMIFVVSVWAYHILTQTDKHATLMQLPIYTVKSQNLVLVHYKQTVIK